MAKQSEQQKSLLDDEVSFDLSYTGYYQSPTYSGVNFSFDLNNPIKPNVEDYNPPVYAAVDFTITGEWIAPPAESANFSLEYVAPPEPPDCVPDWLPLKGDQLNFYFQTCDNSEEIVGVPGDELFYDFNCCPDDPEPECHPDWIFQAGDQLKISVNSESGLPDWVTQDGGNLTISVDCENVKPSCEPDFVNQPGNAIRVDYNSCDDNPDFINQPGNTLSVDFDCCDNVNPDLVLINGNIRLELEMIGGLYFDPNMVTTIGNFNIGELQTGGVVDRGEYVLGITRLDPVILQGEVLHGAHEYLVNGNITFDVKMAGVAEYIAHREIEGNIELSLKTEGEIFIRPDIIGMDTELPLIMEGYAEIVVPTVVPSVATIDPLVMVGQAEYNTVPTLVGNIALDLKVEGTALYVDLPTVWGTPTLELSFQQDKPIENGAMVYWKNFNFDIKIEGELMHPQPIDGFYNGIGELSMQGVAVAAAVGSTKVMSLGELKMNRGWLEFGPPMPPTLREIYEASNVRSNSIPSYPIDAKYPIYVPTTDYNIKNVALRRGTLDYTVEFAFDAIDVTAVKVWIVDENGNAQLVSIAKWLGADEEDHILKTPFRYSLNIPVHCVNDKRFEFMLEIVYQDVLHDGSVSIERKSHYIPFQAHFDNRIPFANTTDRTTMVDGLFDGMGSSLLVTQSMNFDPQTQSFEDVNGGVHCSNGLIPTDDFNPTYYELTMIRYMAWDKLNSGYGTGFAGDFKSLYVELDVGQIGG